MNPALTWATTVRVLRQLKHDPRTIALLLIAPSLLLFLLRYVFNDERFFDQLAPPLVAIFPFIMLFLLTSMATLSERQNGTLERLMTLPTGRLTLLTGYAAAFTLIAAVQVGVVVAVALLLGMDVEGPVWLLIVVALADALLGIALGLFASAFARTQFQVVQFMPAFIMPQVLLCGLFAPREQMHQVLEWISYAMPLSYAVDAMNEATGAGELTTDLAANTAVVLGFVVLALLLGSATLRRRTP